MTRTVMSTTSERPLQSYQWNLLNSAQICSGNSFDILRAFNKFLNNLLLVNEIKSPFETIRS